MKFLVSLLFVSGLAFSQEQSCHLISFRGLVQTHKGYQLLLNKGSMSEKTLVIPERLLIKIAPYLKMNVKGDMILARPSPENGEEVLDILNLDHDMPDPLNPAGSVKLLKQVPCP